MEKQLVWIENAYGPVELYNAAPELYEALNDLLLAVREQMNNHTLPFGTEKILRARSKAANALRKARGQNFGNEKTSMSSTKEDNSRGGTSFIPNQQQLCDLR
jgi:hypothetical protein